jgi:hypothetical protein
LLLGLRMVRVNCITITSKQRINRQQNQLLLPTEEFLFETLAHHPTMHFRNASGYVTIRRWRKALKSFQLSSLRITKRSPSEFFVDRVADEMLLSLERIVGVPAFTNVVPVPPGSSGKADSLSIRLSQRIASCIGATHTNCLIAPPTPVGRSHPKKSAQLGEYSLGIKIKGWALLVDDVASSGRHMELAQSALKASGVPVVGLVWIGQ